MHIATLSHTPLSQIVDCLISSFRDYPVQMPENPAYWQKRFDAAGTNYSLSTGLFEGDRLVGFVIHAISSEEGKNIAFNTGTGIHPAYRGHKWVDKMYEFVIPLLKEKGIHRCRLEVIDSNHRAVRVYQRIGFEVIRKMRCFKGELPGGDPSGYVFTEMSLKEIESYGQSHAYSWDHQMPVIRRLREIGKFGIFRDNLMLGYVILNPQNGYLLQIESKEERWKEVFEALLKITPHIKINNVHEERGSLIQFLEDSGIDSTIDQFEMDWEMGGSGE